MKKIYIALLLAFPLWSNADQFQSPKFSENLNEKYLTDESKSRLESHIYLSYIIDEKGVPQDIIMVNQGPFRDISGLAKQYFSKLRYQPAMNAGVPIKVEQRQHWKLGKKLLGSTNEGVSVGFSKAYDALNHAIKNKNTSTAKDAQSQLKTRVKNLDEQAHYAWVSARYFALVEDWANYNESAFQAWVLRQYLPEQYAYYAIKNMFEVALHQKDFRLAKSVVNTFRSIKGISLTKEVYEEYMTAIDTELNKYPELKKTYNGKAPIYHKLSRTTVDVSSNNDDSYAIQLRCVNLVKELGQTNGFTLPIGARNCRVVVKGSDVNQVTITESGLSHLDT
ncbi:hypothetical protein ACFSJY_14455 [Thalassotalea euphylliae]|uniref:hypothetical protein n=1 Tax=Thalassotalea euphylliae TaxID=1655234 RepID=UPI00363A6479